MSKIRVESINEILYGENSKSVLTGFVAMDNLLSDIDSYGVVTIAGRPGMGKTAYVVNLLKGLSECNTLISFICLNCEPKDITNKMLANKTQTRLYDIKYPCGPEESYTSVFDAKKELSNYYMYFTKLDPNNTESILEFINEQHNNINSNQKHVIIIDGLSYRNTDIYKYLESLAYQLNALIIVTYTNSRDSEQERYIPSISKYESYDLDVVIYSRVLLGLYRYNYYNFDSTNYNADLYILKANDSKFHDCIHYEFNGQTQTYKELPYDAIYE